jgi:cysteine protease ATG4
MCAAVSTPIKRNGSVKKGKRGKKKRGKIPSPFAVGPDTFSISTGALAVPGDGRRKSCPMSRPKENSIYTARAKDGGRMQSGGINGVITENLIFLQIRDSRQP